MRKKVKHYGIIYMATNLIDGKVYIGQTTNDLVDRKYGHISDKYSLFSKVIKEEGTKNFSFKEMCKCYNKTDLDKKEVFYIKKYKSNSSDYGYNRTPGNKKIGKRKPPQTFRSPEDLEEMIALSIKKTKRTWSSEVIQRLYSTFRRSKP